MPRLRILFVLLVACCAAPVHALSLSGFKSGMVSFLLEKISVPGQFEIRADTVEKAGPGATVLAGVHISDATGTWMQADRFVLEWSPSRLLKGEVQIDRLVLSGGRLERLPLLPPAPATDKAVAAKAPAEWPRSPITVAVKELLIENFQVGEKVVPGGLSFTGKGALRDEGAEQSIELAVERTDAVRGSISLSLRKNFDQDTLHLRLAADEAGKGLIATLGGLGEDVPVRLALAGDGTSARWQGELELAAGEHLAATGAVTAQWAEKIAGSLEGRVQPGARLPVAIRDAIGAEARLSLAIAEDAQNRIRIETAQLQSATLHANASGSFGRETSDLDLRLTAEVSAEGARRLSGLIQPAAFDEVRFDATLVGPADALSFEGRGVLKGASVAELRARTVNLEARMAPEGKGRRVAVDLVALEPSGSDPQLAQALGQRLAASLRGTMVEGRVTIESATVTSAAFASKVSGAVALGEVIEPDLEYALEVPDLARFRALSGVDLSGSALARGTLSGPVGGLGIKGHLSTRRTVLNGEVLGSVTVKHDVSLGEALRAAVDLRMDSPTFGKGKALARIHQSPQHWKLEGVDADLLGVRASGELQWPRSAKGAARGQFDLEVASLGPIGRLAGTPLEGSGRGALKLEPEQRGTATLALSLKEVVVGDVRLADAAADATVQGLLKDPSGRIEIKATRGQAAGTELDNLTLVLDGDRKALNLRTEADGTWEKRRFAASTTARANLAGKVQTVILETLTLNLADEKVALQAPATVTLDEGTATIDALVLVLPDDGRINASGSWSPRSLNGKLELAQLPLRLVSVFAEVPVTAGKLGAQLSVSTGAARPQLDGAITVAGVRAEAFPTEVASLQVEIKSTWDGTTLGAESTVTGNFGEPLRADVQLPLRAGDTWLPTLLPEGPLQAKATWQGDLQRLFALLPLPDHLIDGAALLDVRVGGTLKGPQVGGQFTISKGRYENLLTGTLVQDLEVATDLANGDSLTFRLSGNDGDKGTVSAQGSIANLGGGDPRIEVVSELKDFFIVRNDSAAAEAFGRVTVNGVVSSMDVAGSVTVQRAEIRLLSNLPASVVDLGEVRILGEPVPEPKRGGAAGQNIRLDLAVEFPERIFVRGRGLDSEWGGGLKVGGTAAQPLVVGRINARRGQLDLIGRIFKLERGEIVFAGTKVIDPAIAIRLEREANGITGRISVEGVASEPELSFSAVPPVAEDEVLARVLFGRSSANLSASEALQLAAGVAALTSGEAGVVDNLRQSLGVDVLRIESATEEGGTSSASIGRYVREGLYVGAKQALDGTTGSVVVEYEALENVVIDADMGSAGGSVGVTWRKDF